MTKELNEDQLKQQAMQYLKDHYDEDTVSMDVKSNGVEGGDGVLHVDCTVSMGGSQSDWTKWFTFKNGEVTDMRAQMR